MKKSQDKDLLKKVEDSLDTIRPYLQIDGGNIEVVEITEDNVVKVRLLGNCENCPMSFMTMKAGVEEALRKAVPDIKRIEAINVNG